MGHAGGEHLLVRLQRALQLIAVPDEGRRAELWAEGVGADAEAAMAKCKRLPGIVKLSQFWPAYFSAENAAAMKKADYDFRG
jgi:hypothetical protein